MAATNEALAELFDKYIEAHEKLAYSIPHAAKKLDIGTRTLWRMKAEGKVATIKVNGSTRITAQELARLITDAERRAEKGAA